MMRKLDVSELTVLWVLTHLEQMFGMVLTVYDPYSLRRKQNEVLN